MNIVLSKDLFLEHLSSAVKFSLSKNSSLPLFGKILIKGEKNRLHFYSTNLSFFYHSTMEAKNNSSFDLVIEPKKIIEFISFFSSGEIMLEIKEKEIAISQKQNQGHFPVVLIKDFPLPPKIDKKPQKIKTDFFLKNLPLVLYSASTDETRAVLTGVNFVSYDDYLLIVSTDGFRLSLLKIKKEINIPSLIVPSSFLSELDYFFRNEKEVLFCHSPEEKLIGFKVNNYEIYSRLIEGEYPPFEKVIPAEKKTTIELDREELIKNIKLIAVFAKDFSNIVVFQTLKDRIQLTPKTDLEGQSVVYQEAKIDGLPQKVAFNYRFVLDFLNHTEGERVLIELVRPDAPAVFKTSENKDLLHIIMPVRIQE